MGPIPKNVPTGGRTETTKFMRPFPPRPAVQTEKKQALLERISGRMGTKLRRIFEYFLNLKQ